MLKVKMLYEVHISPEIYESCN